MGSKRSCPSFDLSLSQKTHVLHAMMLSTTNDGLTHPADRWQGLSPHAFVTAAIEVTFGLERKVGSEILQKAWCLELYAYG